MMLAPYSATALLDSKETVWRAHALYTNVLLYHRDWNLLNGIPFFNDIRSTTWDVGKQIAG